MGRVKNLTSSTKKATKSPPDAKNFKNIRPVKKKHGSYELPPRMRCDQNSYSNKDQLHNKSNWSSVKTSKPSNRDTLNVKENVCCNFDSNDEWNMDHYDMTEGLKKQLRISLESNHERESQVDDPINECESNKENRLNFIYSTDSEDNTSKSGLSSNASSPLVNMTSRHSQDDWVSGYSDRLTNYNLLNFLDAQISWNDNWTNLNERWCALDVSSRDINTEFENEYVHKQNFSQCSNITAEGQNHGSKILLSSESNLG